MSPSDGRRGRALAVVTVGCAWIAGCGGATTVTAGGARTTRATATHATRARELVDAGALETLRTAIQSGDAAALRSAGVTLHAASGAREMTGEPAPDERVERATLVARDGASAAVLILTSCGNAQLSGMQYSAGRWTGGERVALVEGMEPGRCGETNVRAEAIALSSDVHREIAVVAVSQDATGESVRGPFLSVFQLRPAGRFAPMLRDAPFGAMDDATGATTTAVFNVVEDVPAPRDLFVEIRPGRPGPGGAPASEIVRRRYAIRGTQLEMVEQTTEAAE